MRFICRQRLISEWEDDRPKCNLRQFWFVHSQKQQYQQTWKKKESIRSCSSQTWIQTRPFRIWLAILPKHPPLSSPYNCVVTEQHLKSISSESWCYRNLIYSLIRYLVGMTNGILWKARNARGTTLSPGSSLFPKGGRERTLGKSLGYLGFRFRYKLDFKDNFYGDSNSRFNTFQILGKLYL